MGSHFDEETPTFTLDDINHAFDDGEFCFYLQPKCNAVTGAIVGMEALIRWNHPEYGVITPDRFIPLLEQAKMVTRFDFYIWRSVCEMLARWQREGRNTVPVSVNVSMTDIDAVDVARTLGDMLDRYGVDPGLLQVEITESVIAQNFEVVASTIHDLHECGIAVLMDDFGSAYSSLNMLKDINVEAIKLDMKFLDLNFDNEAKGLKIVEAVLDMAYQLRIGVIAEGAQTAQQVNQLRELGCIYIQGYFFFKPLTVEQAEDLLEKRSDCHQFWNISRDLRQKDYRKSHGGRALLESSSVAAHAFELLEKGVSEISRLNLMTGEYRVIRRDSVLPEVPSDDFSDYCETLVDERIIHPRDAMKFLTFMNLPDLRHRLFDDRRSVFTYFASEIEAESGIVAFNILVSDEVGADDPWAVVLVETNLPFDLLARDLQIGYRQDSLTGLLNRNAYDADVRRKDIFAGKSVVCMYIDLIGLHEVNNHLGHAKGDKTLCDVADAARAFFGDDRIYRIGGDEFVVLSSSHTLEQTRKQAFYMATQLRDRGCEISVGMATAHGGDDLPKAIEQAETEMRAAKKAYYAQNGNRRQARMLNEKLEGILVHSQDMEQLLWYLHVRYTVAYVVDLRADTHRPIVSGQLFLRMLREHGGSFKETIHAYCDEMVAPQCRSSFQLLFDYEFVQARVRATGALQYGYTKTNGERILITIFPSRNSAHETIWVFSKADLPQVEEELFDD